MRTVEETAKLNEIKNKLLAAMQEKDYSLQDLFNISDKNKD